MKALKGWSKTALAVLKAIALLSCRPSILQASYKIDNVFRADGFMQPYAKWQTYRGAWKAALNSPRVAVDEVETGVEYQINKALELTLAYAFMDRTNTSTSDKTTSSYLGQARGDMGRMQLQWNY